MRTVLAICLVLTVFGALNAAIAGMTGQDMIQLIMGEARTVGTDFLRILTGFSAVVILVWGLKRLYAASPE